MYIFLSADGKIAYLYDDVIFNLFIPIIFYTRNTFIATPREGVNAVLGTNWNQPIGKKKKKKKDYKKKRGKNYNI